MYSALASREGGDALYGWITDIPPDLTINKGTACDIYLLDFEDLGDRDDVRYEDRRVREKYYCKEYKERDIEWKAWEKYGGPIEYWQVLKRRMQEKRLRSNLLPFSYRRGGRYDLSLAAPPALQDRYICDSIALHAAKRVLPSWIWDACNKVLDEVFLDGGIPLSAKDLTYDREDAMRLAVSFFRDKHQLYASRPDEPLGPSPCMTTLRQVLSEAPTPPEPGSKAWGGPAQGLDFDRSGTLDFYVWNEEYLRRVLTAVRGVIEALGPSAAGWEVYHKYSQLPGLALRYDRKERQWYDPAAGWLAGKLSKKELQGHLPSQGSAENISDKPPLEASSCMSESAQRPSQPGASAVSPVSSPSGALKLSA